MNGDFVTGSMNLKEQENNAIDQKISSTVPAVFFTICLLMMGACSSTSVAPLPDAQNENLQTQLESQSNELELEVGLDKSIYKVGEQINPTVRIKNIAPRVVSHLVNARLLIANDIHFVILDDDGNKARWKLGNPTWPSLKTHDFVNLCASCEFRRTYLILNDYYDLSQRGDYTIQVKYTNDSDPEDGEIAWHGTLMSNVVYFSIVP